jgi:hypothetical protein
MLWMASIVITDLKGSGSGLFQSAVTVTGPDARQQIQEKIAGQY